MTFKVEECQISKLPPELLSKIFLLTGKPAIPLRRQSSFPLLAVSRHWQAISYKTPELWTNILINVPPSQLVDLPSYLELSCSCNLQLSFEMPRKMKDFGAMMSWSIKILSEHRGRWETVYISDQLDRAFFMNAQFETPKLKSYTVARTTADEELPLPVGYPIFPTMTETDLLWRNLRDLEIRSKVLIDSPGPIFYSVRRLKLTRVSVYIRFIASFSTHFPNLNVFELRSVDVKGNLRQGDPELEHVMLPHLTTFICDRTTSYLLVRFILRMSPTLESLELELGFTIMAPQVKLPDAPSLQHLTIKFHDGTIKISTSLKDWLSLSLSLKSLQLIMTSKANAKQNPNYELTEELFKWLEDHLPNLDLLTLQGLPLHPNHLIWTLQCRSETTPSCSVTLIDCIGTSGIPLPTVFNVPWDAVNNALAPRL